MTNNYNLPKALVRAISLDTHRADGDISTTQLLKNPREFWLTARHSEEIEEDAISKLWALFGTASHAIAERGECAESLVEEYLKAEFNGIKLTGSLDLYEDGILWDYKTVSVWGVLLLDAQKKAQFIGQLNTYAYMLKKQGMEVKGLRILAIMRDWVSSKAKFDPSYPDFQAQVIEIPLFTEQQQLQYIFSRIERLMKYKDVPDNELPECTEAYRWAKPSEYAVMKKGRKSAVRLFDSEKMANDYIVEKFSKTEKVISSDEPDYNRVIGTNIKIDKNYSVEARKGDLFKRCEYCSGRKFCNQTEYTEVEWRREHQNIKVEMGFNQFMEETKQW